MVHTVPDYSGKYRLESLYGNIDSSEIPARLGSPVTHDRRGLVLWYDDFEGTVLRWGTMMAGVGASAALNTTHSRSGIQAVKCTTGNAIGNHCGIVRYLAYPFMSKVGFEISFMHNANIDYYVQNIFVYNGTTSCYGTIRIDVTADALQYYNDVGVATTFQPDLPVVALDKLFMTSKLVIDPVNGYYTRYILNNVEYDLSNNLLNVNVDGTHPYYYVRLLGFTAVNANTAFYLDDAIVTIDEPG